MAASEHDIPRAARLADLLDSKFELFGVRFGLDPIIGLVPVLGDTITLVMGLSIVRDAWKHRVRKAIIFRMLLNLGVDWLVGQIPVVGDLTDFFIRPNARNAKLLRREHEAGRLRNRA